MSVCIMSRLVGDGRERQLVAAVVELVVVGGATERRADRPQAQPRLQHCLRERALLLLRVPRPAHHTDRPQRGPDPRAVSGQAPPA